MNLRMVLTESEEKTKIITDIDSFEINKSINKPYKSLKVKKRLDNVIDINEFWVAREIEIYSDQHRLFKGQRFKQELQKTGEGLKLELEARSQGSSLIENKAHAGVYKNISLSEVISGQLRPNRFTDKYISESEKDFSINRFTILPGSSQWAVLRKFIEEGLGRVVYIDEMEKIRVSFHNKGKILSNEREVLKGEGRNNYIKLSSGLGRKAMINGLGEYYIEASLRSVFEGSIGEIIRVEDEIIPNCGSDYVVTEIEIRYREKVIESELRCYILDVK